MSLITRRQGLWTLAGGVVAATVIGTRAIAQAMPKPAAQTLALIEKNEGRVAFYAVPSGKRVGVIPLGTQPHEIVADPAGRYAFIGDYGVESWKAPGAGGHRIWVIDLEKKTLVRSIDLAPYGRLHAVRMDSRGRLYVLSEKDSVLARFDTPATDEAPSRLVSVTGVRSHYLVIHRDGTRAYVADTLSGGVIMVDPDDMSVAPVRRHIGVAPEAMTLSRDERTLFVIDRPSGTLHALDAASLAPRMQRTMRGEAVRIVTQTDGRLIVSNTQDKSLSRLNPTTLAEEDYLSLPAAAPGLTIVGDTLYAALQTDRVAIVDLRAWQVVGGFATGSAPDSAVLIR